MTKKLLSLAVLAAGMFALGCGKGKGTAEASATVTGKVTLSGGRPLPGGTINFRSTTAAHRLGTGEINADGTYTAKDVPQGPCKVFVDNTGLKPIDKTGGYMPPEGTRTPLPGTKYVPITAKYTSEATTDLTTNVDKDPFEYNVELK